MVSDHLAGFTHLGSIPTGINRPGAMERAINGLTTKIE